MARSSTTWQKGIASPNPGGRPKFMHDLQELARQHTSEAIETLVKIMRNDNHAPNGADAGIVARGRLSFIRRPYIRSGLCSAAIAFCRLSPCRSFCASASSWRFSIWICR